VSTPKIDLEGHFFTDHYVQLLQGRRQPPRQEVDGKSVRLWVEPSVPDLCQESTAELQERLLDLGSARLAAMDDAGVRVQVLGISNPATEQLEPEVAGAVARAVNDELAAVVRRHPTRFAALATVAAASPDAASAELERCVRELGFRGLMLRTHVRDEFLDAPRFRPIFETAARLGVPVCLHPTVPHARLIESLLGYGWSLPGPALGYGVETAIHTMRLVYSGLFDDYPTLQVVVGLLGAALSFWTYRMDFAQPWMAPRRGPRLERRPTEYLRDNLYVTTAGNFLDSALASAVAELGVDRVLFGSDYPFATLREASDFVEGAALSADERDRICHRNAERLLGL
jgi:predicted TIM-barrel fold metal-dependent hydrolase